MKKKRAYVRRKDRRILVQFSQSIWGTEGFMIYNNISEIASATHVDETREDMYIYFKTVKDSEKDYPTHDLELATVILVQKTW